MEANKSLRRPANWQDFESLCKKLWGEIWQYPEIKKNGRQGQEQHGVDVYGIPKGETKYYGIQCKGKDEYTDKQFTEAEILREIEKAKKFKPALLKYYLTTTAVKDAKVEEFVRETNQKHIAEGLFEVHIFSWEDIVELIDENPETHDWYVINKRYKSKKSVEVSFSDGTKEIICKPRFRQRSVIYKQNILPANRYSATMIELIANNPFPEFHIDSGLNDKTNLSYFNFSLKIHNAGLSLIEGYKIQFALEGDIEDLSNTNVKRAFVNNTKRTNIKISARAKTGEVIPENNILVSDDTLISDPIFIKTKPENSKIIIKWRMISIDYKCSGELMINVQPEIIQESKEVATDDYLKVKKGIEKLPLEEYIIIG